MGKNKGTVSFRSTSRFTLTPLFFVAVILERFSPYCVFIFVGKGGKNRRRGKNDSEGEKRELTVKEEGQGKRILMLL